MSGCIDRHQVVTPMTGSTVTGQLQPHDEEPKTRVDIGDSSSPGHHRTRHRMTPVPPECEKIDQPIQLTPLWEHVVTLKLNYLTKYQ